MPSKSTTLLEKLHELWLSFTLKRKIGTFAGAVILIVGISVISNIVMLDFALNGFSRILDDNVKSYDVQQSLEVEMKVFETYMRRHTLERKKEYDLACVRTKRCIDALPFDYEAIGLNRYAKTWGIRNAYEAYCIQRDYVLDIAPQSEIYVKELYKAYQMQEHLITYAKRLVQTTLKEGNKVYQNRVPDLYRIPYIVCLAAVIMLAVVLYLSWLMKQSLLVPIMNMAHISRKIAKNDFSTPDVEIKNKDEMGELVRAFNTMKHFTEGYITALEEKNQMTELLHKEALEKVEMEKHLDAMNLELLKSQINPHFLFNTLNMIASMAKLEDAGTTEQMITCLSNIFRYNLKTPESVVFLKQELNVLGDYMYLQQMRFGNRISYEMDCKVDDMRTMIPAFTLQPIVENAIIHGLSKKEEGGSIYIRIWSRGHIVTLSVADTGIGMSDKMLRELQDELKEHKNRPKKLGIGVGNIYQRIEAMYPDGFFRLYSKEGVGTVVQMGIPQNET